MEEFYKQCVVCRVIYEGDVTKYDQNSTVSHGVCNDINCKIEYVRESFGCDVKSALIIIGGLEKRLQSE